MKVLTEIVPITLPTGWPMRRVRDVATLVNGFPFKSEDFDSSGDVPLVRIRDLTACDFELYIPEYLVPPQALLRNGDLAIGMDGDFNSVLWSRGPAALNQRVCILRPRNGTDIGFLGYVLPSVLQIINDLTYSTTVKHLSGSDVLQQLIPFPDFKQQQRISQFLDAETAQIDELIQKQERLIELLTEKRQAVITHAVTKGLDPAAPTKPSGAPWLGDIPAHWDVSPMGSAADLIQTGPFGSQIHAEDYISGGTPLINPSHLLEGVIAPNFDVAVSEEKAQELQRHVLRTGDIVVARRGELGRNAVVTEREEGFLCGTGSLLIRLRSNAYLPEYFSLVFGGQHTRDRLSLHSIGATMDNLNAGLVAGLRLVRPPLAEQELILKRLSRTTDVLDETSRKALRSIDLLRERRKALISAAVTGQLKVTQYV